MNNKIGVKNQERMNHLLMGAVDGELTHQEQLEFEQLLKQHPDLNQQWQKFRNLKEVTQTMKFKSPPAEVWDKYWLNIYNRIERSIAWILVSIGAIILIVYGLYHAIESLIADTQLQGIIKIAVLAVLAGLVILLVSVLREKLIIRKSDPYKEVQR